ncbi:hypothetical protein APY94_03495 [Thermococcus celericrescens]|uniref:Class III signal peptide-containing protein n=1 Tax=Thermococcus celericrescens TaxID=227598 RepID=A0A100XYZ1_9EURY|nr:class III signal peptide-containing protein [Thermococcus celericrescens]KUH34049.1 hypothetical protein APY94_03495 [Thermococcus celericrescens]
MSRLAGSRKGQTSVEMLFIVGIILAGVVVIIPLYTQESGDSVMLAAVRDAAAQAAVYIETGVISDKPEYEALNDIIKNYTEYGSVGFRFAGLGVTSESDEKVTITVKFTHDLSSNSSRDSKIAKGIGRFFREYLKDVRGFRLDGGHLYYAGRLVEFNVTVGETWEVVS